MEKEDEKKQSQLMVNGDTTEFSLRSVKIKVQITINYYP